MKFVIHPQHGIKQVSITVWDAEANKELCTFVDGEFETDNQAVIDKLFELGYEGVDCPVPPDPKPVAEASEEEIRAQAKALGIKSWHVKSVETLKDEIAEKEGVE